MDRIFLSIPKESQDFSYLNLLTKINNNNYFYKSKSFKDPFEFYVNFITALLSDDEIILLDSFYNEKNIKNKYESNEIKKYSISIKSVSELISSIKNSKSKIKILSSGTTGEPKLITQTIGTFLRSVKIGEQNSSDVWALTYNPSHMAGLQVFFQAILNFNSIIYLFNQENEIILKSIAKYNITHISGTPTFYKLLSVAQISYPNILRVTIGGEKSDL